MTDTASDEYALVEALGEAASHEHAAGFVGYLMQDKLDDTLDGSQIVQKYIPDLQSVQPHLGDYKEMIEQMGYDAGDHVEADLASEYQQLIPEGDVTPEYAAAVAGFLESRAEDTARNALEAAENTEKGMFYRSSIEAIGRDEQGESQELRDLLDREFGWNDRDDVSYDDLTSVENVLDVRDRL